LVQLSSSPFSIRIPGSASGTWVFDDPDADLVREPFVSGVTEMIDELVKEIQEAREGFHMTFSAGPILGFQRELEWLREEFDGHWYRSLDLEMEGWLCPVLFKYFDKAPEKLYVRADPLE
jgi:hypothetical protein